MTIESQNENYDSSVAHFSGLKGAELQYFRFKCEGIFFIYFSDVSKTMEFYFCLGMHLDFKQETTENEIIGLSYRATDRNSKHMLIFELQRVLSCF